MSAQVSTQCACAPRVTARNRIKEPARTPQQRADVCACAGGTRKSRRAPRATMSESPTDAFVRNCMRSSLRKVFSNFFVCTDHSKRKKVGGDAKLKLGKCDMKNPKN